MIELTTQQIELIKNVSDNPAAIRWPLDEWGFTAEMRKAFTKTVGRLSGNAQKEQLLLATITLMAAHLKARSDKDKKNAELRRKRMKEAAEKRAPLEAFNVPTPTKEKVDG